MRWTFFLFFLMTGAIWAAEIKVSDSICDQILLDHLPDADVAYAPEEDEIPADIGGAIKITPPKVFQIPVKLDIRKYLRAPEKQTAENKEKLNQSVASIENNLNQLTQDTQLIQTNQASILNANEAIEQGLQAPVINLPVIENHFSQAAADYQVALNNLQQIAPRLESVSSGLAENYTLLKKQFNPYETDENKQVNQGLQNNSQTHVESGLNQLTTSRLQTEALADNLNKTIELLEASPNTFTNKPVFEEQLQTLKNQLQQTQALYANMTAQEQKKLTELKQKISQLNQDQNTFVEEAELGTIEVHEDGRLYFNDQPLFREDEFALKKACQAHHKP